MKIRHNDRKEMTMLQMILTRLSSAFERAFAFLPEKADTNLSKPDAAATPRFSRDEDFYWAMHAHW